MARSTSKTDGRDGSAGNRDSNLQGDAAEPVRPNDVQIPADNNGRDGAHPSIAECAQLPCGATCAANVRLADA